MRNGNPTTYPCGCVWWYHPVYTSQLHRLDGPACDNTNCDRENTPTTAHVLEYYINAKKFSKEDYEKKIEQMKQELNKHIQLALCKCYAWLIVQKGFWKHEARDRFSVLEREWLRDFDQRYDKDIHHNIMEVLPEWTS